MADLKISGALASKPAAALDGTEAFYVLQDGETKGGTIDQVKTFVGAPEELDDLSDVDLTTTAPVPGDTLTFNGTEWVPVDVIGDHVAESDPHAQYAELSGGADANFTAMPQVGGDPIVESDSNADGEFTRWADGTQVTDSIYSKSGSGEETFNTPASFLDSSFVVVSSAPAAFRLTTSRSATASTVVVDRFNGSESSISGDVYVHAKGFWK